MSSVANMGIKVRYISLCGISRVAGNGAHWTMPLGPLISACLLVCNKEVYGFECFEMRADVGIPVQPGSA